MASGVLKILKEIQQLDTEILSIEKEEEELRRKIDEATREIKRYATFVEKLEEDMEGLRAERREREERLQENRDRIDRDQQRLNEVKNDRQYKALLKEIENAEKAVRLLDMEMASLSDKITRKQEELTRKKESVDEKTRGVESLKEELAQKEARWREEIEAIKTKRQALVEGLNPVVVRRYELIRQRRGGVGITGVKNETCLGCFIQIPPQVYNQLRKGSEELITCPHCHRILYFDGNNEPSAT